MNRSLILVRPRLLLFAIAALVASTLALQHVRPAGAFWGWCFDDPEITVNGQPLTIVDGVQADPTTAQKNILAANIVVKVPNGVTVNVVSVTNTYWPQHISVVYSGSYTPGKPVNVNVTTSFSLAKGTAALNSSMHLAWNGTQTNDAQATVQGSMARTIAVHP
jgi:hypothetical protein